MPFLMATALTFTCSDVSEMVQKVRMSQMINSAMKQEIVDMYEVHLTEAADLECTWDAND